MSDPNAVPIPLQGFQLEELDGETLLYRHSEKKLVYLNESAALVWKLCDGNRTAREITSLLVDVYPEARETIAADVTAAIESLVREGVLRTSSQPEQAN